MCAFIHLFNSLIHSFNSSLFIHLITNLRLENCQIREETILLGQYRLREHSKHRLTDLIYCLVLFFNVLVIWPLDKDLG